MSHSSATITDMVLASEVGALAILTLVVAIVGAITGALSLGWAILSHRSAGVRVAVDFAPGLVSPSGFISFTPTKARSAPIAVGATGEPAFGVTVRNTGRLPARVVAVTLHSSRVSATIFEMPFSPRLPHSVDVSDRATWFFGMNEAIGLVSAAGTLSPRADEVYATVELGSGVKVTSRRVSLRQTLESFVALKTA